MHVLVTRRLTLRQPAQPDAEDIALWLSNRAVARMLARVPHPYFRKDAEDWIDSVSGWPDALVYTIHRERLIGVVSVIDSGGGPALGYWLGEAWHGHGFMTEAANALLTHAFASQDIDAVGSSAVVDNPASLRGQQKLGFRITGQKRVWSRSRAAPVNAWTTRLTAAAFSGTMDATRRAAA